MIKLALFFVAMLLPNVALAGDPDPDQIFYDIVIAHIDRRQSPWQDLGEDSHTLSADDLVLVRHALDDAQIVAHPHITSLVDQNASFDMGASGGEFLTASLVAGLNDDSFNLDFSFESNETRGPVAWAGVVPASLDGVGGLYLRPRRDMVIVVQLVLRSQPSGAPSAPPSAGGQ